MHITEMVAIDALITIGFAVDCSDIYTPIGYVYDTYEDFIKECIDMLESIGYIFITC